MDTQDKGGGKTEEKDKLNQGGSSKRREQVRKVAVHRIQRRDAQVGRKAPEGRKFPKWKLKKATTRPLLPSRLLSPSKDPPREENLKEKRRTTK